MTKSIESEEFYNLLQQYRCASDAMGLQKVVAAYQAILEYVDNHVKAQQKQIFESVIIAVEECFVDKEGGNRSDMEHNTTVFDCVYAIRTLQAEQLSEDEGQP